MHIAISACRLPSPRKKSRLKHGHRAFLQTKASTACLAVPTTAISLLAVSMTALLQSRLLRAIGSMLQIQTKMVDTLQAESIAITSAFLLLFFVCGVALLQSRLRNDSAEKSYTERATEQATQHRASMIQPRNHTLLSRTNTTAAELYYLRHMRSCAAAAMGHQGGNPSPSTAFQISGASFIGRLLQSIWRHC